MDEKEIHLRDYLRIINKRRNTVFTFFTVVFLLVVIATFTTTPIFRASTKVMVERESSSPLTSGYGYIAYDPEFLETQYQVITSKSVALKVVDLLGAEKMYSTFFGNEKKGGSFLGALFSSDKNEAASSASGPSPEEAAADRADQMATVIQAGIRVSPVKDSRVVEISYESENAALASQVVNSVAQAYINELLDMRMAISDYSIAWMTKKAETQREKLEKSEKAFQEYQRKQDIVTVEDRVALLPERLSEFSKRLAEAQAQKKELQAVYDQIVRTDRLETIPVISENDAVAALNQQILKSEQNISDLSKKYGQKHPAMVSATAELSGLRGKKQEEIQKIVQTIKNKYHLAESNEADLNSLLQDTKFENANLNEKNIQMGMLKREVETNRNLYNSLLEKLKEKDITGENRSVNVWVIEKADMPEYPAKPNKKRNILLALMLGLFGGAGLAFFFEYLDNTVKSPEDIEEKFNTPVIGTISLLKTEETIVHNVLSETSNMISEGFKSLRTAIFLSSADRAPGSLVVSSMSPGEGKSSICACLAATIARSGKKTLLIDADMRRPVQHQNFKLDNTRGLSSFLAGMTPDNFINPTPVENLYIVTAGPIPPNPSELLHSEKMGKLIQELSGIYDMIIIDSPPVLSVSDPLIISKHVAGVVLVSWVGSTTYEALQKGIKLFKEISVPILGVILNRFDAKKSGYYYGHGDYYYSSDEKKA